MAEEKEGSFKITDRRKFNADGTPREQPDEPVAPEIEPAPIESQTSGEAAPQPDAQQAPDNVVSFPGESAKRKEAADMPPPPGEAGASDQPTPEQNAAASVTSAQVKAAASAYEQAYKQ